MEATLRLRGLRNTVTVSLFAVLLFSCYAVREANTEAEDSSSYYYSRRRYGAESVDCQNVTKIVFVSFFPCLRTDGDTDFKASERLGECDLLAEAAAYLAVDRVNQDPDILTNITLELYPIYIPTSKESITLHNQYETIFQIFQLFYETERSVSDIIWGLIGPGDSPGIANFIAPIGANSGLLTLSYGARTTSTKTDKIPTFYKTLPSDFASNIGRLVLLVNHKWYRIAILKSNNIMEEQYAEEASHFITVFNRYIENYTFHKLNLDILEAFDRSPANALTNIKLREVNIILGFFGPENARSVLCHANSMGLVSADHAWILPSYYNPNWWKLPNGTIEKSNNYCTDEDMREILESVIFINNIKIPPMNLNLADFHSQLLTKAVDLFPSLTEEDLKPYLLRSRATNAYDAVTLLAKSVDVAFKQGGDSCTDTTLIRRELETYIKCEYCRLYSGFAQFFSKDNKDFLPLIQRVCNINTTGAASCETTEYYSESLEFLNHNYGQILYSQFLSVEECPIVLWWPVFSIEEFNHSYLLISGFDDNSNSISKKLNLSRRNFVSNDSSCSTHFRWRGSYSPPSSHFLKTSFIFVSELIFIGLIALFGMTFAAGLLIFNIVFRKNKNVKASSPWLNVLLLVGLFIQLPTTLYYGIIFSAGYYVSLRGIDFTPLCHFGTWQYYIGVTLFVATLIAKNWRIYRIFFNKQLKDQGMKLSDSMLALGVLFIVLPVVVILIIWSSIGLNFNKFHIQNENLQIIEISVCGTELYPIFAGVADTAILLLYLFLFVLSLLTATVPSSSFRREGLTTYKAAFIVILPTPLVCIAWYVLVLSENEFQYRALLWISFCWTSVLPIILLVVLFSPIVFAVVREYFHKKHEIAEEKEKRNLSMHYDDLKRKAESLKTQLEETDKSIMKIKSCLSVSNPMAQCKSTGTTNDKSNELYETDSQMKKTTTAS